MEIIEILFLLAVIYVIVMIVLFIKECAGRKKGKPFRKHIKVMSIIAAVLGVLLVIAITLLGLLLAISTTVMRGM